MRGMVPAGKAAILAAVIGLQACMALGAWADSAAPVTLAVLQFSLNLDIANPDDVLDDRRPARLARASLLRLASQSTHYTLAGDPGGQADLPCTDTDCALRKGRERGAGRVIWGEITKVSTLIWFVSAHLVDVPTATTLYAETLQFRGNMTDVVPRLAEILWRRMHEGA